MISTTSEAINSRINSSFFTRDVLLVAPELLGKNLVRKFSDGIISRFMITDVEAYRGIDDLACHASRGRTTRTEVMFGEGGFAYTYLIYGMYWMLNVVTGDKDSPQAVLIRGISNYNGPGRVGKLLGIDKSFYGEDFSTSNRLWFEHSGVTPKYKTAPRVGVDYAGEYWSKIQWRYIVDNLLQLRDNIY